MPHIQPRSTTSASPPDATRVLDLVAALDVNLLGITGSDVEFDGEMGFLVENDDDIDRIVERLRDAGYQARAVGEADGLHLDYVDDETGGLAQTIRRARQHHRRGVIRDIAVGVRPWGFTLDGKQIVRSQSGDPVPGPDMRLPVQIYFVTPSEYGEDGTPLA